MRALGSLRFICTAGALSALTLMASAAGAAAENWQPIGRDHGLQVYADVVNGTWCQDSVGIKIVADDARTFADGAIDDTLAKVGGKLARSCPRMTGFQVFGEVSPGNQVVYQAIAARDQAWQPMIGKAPAVQRVAVPASTPSAPAASPSAATSRTSFPETPSTARSCRPYPPAPFM